MTDSSKFHIRDAQRGDENTIFALICELAEYEKLRHEVEATPELLRQWVFDDPKCGVLLAEVEGVAVGYALFFSTFSTFLARPGLYLEDLFVQPAHRKNGIGKALIKAVARRAVEQKCGRLEWSVLDWNAPSIGFYESLGATMMNEWKIMRTTGDDLKALAKL